jgi:hypothetical protein
MAKKNAPKPTTKKTAPIKKVVVKKTAPVKAKKVVKKTTLVEVKKVATKPKALAKLMVNKIDRSGVKSMSSICS